MDSLEPRVDKRPTEKGRKGREVVHTTRTGGKEPGQWRAARLARRIHESDYKSGGAGLRGF